MHWAGVAEIRVHHGKKKWNAAGAAVVEKYALVGSVASLLTNQLEDPNRRRSYESSTGKLGDFC